MPTRHQLLQRNWFGGSSQPAQPAVPTASAPPSSTNAASLAVEQATYRQSLRRKGISSTIYAGANGGQPASATNTAAGQPPAK